MTQYITTALFLATLAGFAPSPSLADAAAQEADALDLYEEEEGTYDGLNTEELFQAKQAHKAQEAQK